MKSEDKEKLLKSVPALDFKSFSLVFASSWAEDLSLGFSLLMEHCPVLWAVNSIQAKDRD